MRETGSRALRRGMGMVTGLVLLPLAVGLAVALTLTACGSSGTASPSRTASSSGSSAGAYLGCLLRHEDDPGSARTACASVRPADLAAVLQTFENCLTKHGVRVPPLPAQGRRAALLRFVAGLSTGSTAQRSDLRSCTPSGFPG